LIGQEFETVRIEISAGPEDLILDGNKLIITNAERRPENEHTSGIWSLNLDDNTKTKFELILKKERKFSPLGISLLKLANKKYLFILNYQSKENPEIICFEMYENKLIEVKSFHNELIKETIVKLKGSDNIRALDDVNLLIASHPKILKFIGHAKNKVKLSPFVIYKVNLKTKEKHIAFDDNDTLLSVGSTAISYKNNLYIAQIFENLILKVKLK
jgi:hypothetical protein